MLGMLIFHPAMLIPFMRHFPECNFLWQNLFQQLILNVPNTWTCIFSDRQTTMLLSFSFRTFIARVAVIGSNDTRKGVHGSSTTLFKFLLGNLVIDVFFIHFSLSVLQPINWASCINFVLSASIMLFVVKLIFSLRSQWEFSALCAMTFAVSYDFSSFLSYLFKNVIEIFLTLKHYC